MVWGYESLWSVCHVVQLKLVLFHCQYEFQQNINAKYANTFHIVKSCQNVSLLFQEIIHDKLLMMNEINFGHTLLWLMYLFLFNIVKLVVGILYITLDKKLTFLIKKFYQNFLFKLLFQIFEYIICLSKIYKNFIKFRNVLVMLIFHINLEIYLLRNA